MKWGEAPPWDQLDSKRCANPLARRLGTATCSQHPTPFSVWSTEKLCSGECAPKGCEAAFWTKGRTPGLPNCFAYGVYDPSYFRRSRPPKFRVRGEALDVGPGLLPDGLLRPGPVPIRLCADGWVERLSGRFSGREAATPSPHGGGCLPGMDPWLRDRSVDKATEPSRLVVGPGPVPDGLLRPGPVPIRLCADGWVERLSGRFSGREAATPSPREGAA